MQAELPDHEQIGRLVLAAVDLEASQEFMQLCDEGIRNLTINDIESWEQDTWIQRLPNDIRQIMAD
ncbi:hypothetical protein RB213_003814 [Colletotrichum asianum]